MNNRSIVLTALIFLLTNITGCISNKANEFNHKNVSVQPVQEVSAANSNVVLAVQQALTAGDYRLLHSKGRRIVVPGFEHLELSKLTSTCGIKAMANSSDVIKNTEQRQQQKRQYAFAKQFNQAIYAKCIARLAQ